MFIKHGLTLTGLLELGELMFVAAAGGSATVAPMQWVAQQKMQNVWKQRVKNLTLPRLAVVVLLK